MEAKVVNYWGYNGSSYDTIVNLMVNLYFTYWNFVIRTYFELLI